jgi:integrase
MVPRGRRFGRHLRSADDEGSVIETVVDAVRIWMDYIVSIHVFRFQFKRPAAPECDRRVHRSVRINSMIHSKHTSNARSSAAPIQKTAERGYGFVVVKMRSAREGRVVMWPVLFFIGQNEDASMRVTRCHLLDAYVDDFSAQSNQTRRETCQALGLLTDYSRAALDKWSEGELKAPSLPRRLVKGFCRALMDGTIQYLEGRPVERMGLYWSPRSRRRATTLSQRLAHFFKTVEPEIGNAAWKDFARGYRNEMTPSDEFQLALAAGYRRKTSFLAHLPRKTEERQPGPSHGVITKFGRKHNRIHAFPAKYVFPFLMEGFTNQHGQTDETAQLAAIFLMIGGLRTSEPLHLYCSDVQFEGKEPWVFLHNPEDGELIDEGGAKITRAQFLQRFAKGPRNRDYARDHAGWKSMKGDDSGTPVFWLPIAGITELIYSKLRHYLLVTRPRLMAQRSRTDGDHPFLLVSSGQAVSSKGGKVGDRYTVSAFEAAWETAVGRIATKYNDPDLVYKRVKGTTKHGARHYYGRFLVTLGVRGEIIQECMHHRSYFSHKVYPRLTPGEINAVLQSAAKGEAAPKSVLRQSFERRFEHAATVFQVAA